MVRHTLLSLAAVAALVPLTLAAEPPAVPQPKFAASRIVGVTVYPNNALITREVEVPAGVGNVELVVNPLPPHTVNSSLYSEGNDVLRVLTTRYRMRPVQEDTREEVRQLQAKIRQLQLAAQKTQSEIKVVEQNLAMLAKLEGFTGSTVKTLTEKGLLNADAIIALSKYVMDSRADKSQSLVTLRHDEQENQEETEFAGRKLRDLTAGSSKIERDAVIVVDKKAAAPGTIRLHYLVDAASWHYKAVPVLTSHVYRLADLTNTSKFVLLPGEATMYIGSDFVGRAELPLVAIGEQFTAGFGVDPQLQVQRQLIDKTRTTQGDNQVWKYEYRILVSSYKAEPVKLQLWDRLPHGESESVVVQVTKTEPALSTDAIYVRESKPNNLLRWDLTVEPARRGEKALAVAYDFKLELGRQMTIQSFSTSKAEIGIPLPAKR